MIRTRNDLIEWLIEHAPYPRIKRALLRGGTNENLGGFRTRYRSGWIVNVTSESGKDNWYAYIMPFCMSEATKYFCIVVLEVPWEYWEGDKSDNPLYQGDNPEKYKENRDAAVLQRPNTTKQDP